MQVYGIVLRIETICGILWMCQVLIKVETMEKCY